VSKLIKNTAVAAAGILLLGLPVWGAYYVLSAEDRRIATEQRRFLLANCPDLKTYDDCNAALKRAQEARESQDARAEDERVERLRAARAAAIADLRARQASDPALIDGILDGIESDVSRLTYPSACGPELKSTSSRRRDALDEARRIGDRFGEIVAEPRPAQQARIARLRATLGLKMCHSCGDAEYAACRRKWFPNARDDK